MLDTPPAESERRSWIWVALFTLVIFITIPAARALRDAIDVHAGREVHVYAGIALLLALAVPALLCWGGYRPGRGRAGVERKA